MENFKIHTIPDTYLSVINTVIENSSFDFLEEGVGQEVLQQLREIWERKISEKNVSLPTPPVAHSSRSTKNNTCKKRSAPPCIKLCENIQVQNGVCNRSMPLLSSEDEDEPSSLVNNLAEVIHEVKEQQMLVEPSFPSESKMKQMEIIKNEHELEMLLKFKLKNNTTTTIKGEHVVSNNNIVQKRERRPPKKYSPVITPVKLNNNVMQKRGRGRPRKYAPLTTPVEPNNNVAQKRGRGPPRKYEPVITPVELNNNVAQKRGRGPSRKYEPVITPVELNNNVVQKRGRGRPRKYALVAKPKGVGEIQQFINRSVKECLANGGHKHCTNMQIDGASFYPKFNVIPQFTGIPVETNQERFEEEELNSDDDITDDEEISQVFECDNVITCQYEKVKRVKNRWNINLKCGIMHLKGKDYVFNTASCKVTW